MKKRVKLKMEKEVKVRSSNNSGASPTPEQANLTKPERKSMKLVFKHFSLGPNLLDLANQVAAKAETEGAYEQAESRMKQQRALKEARLSRGLEMYMSYKKRVKESGLGVCKKRFVENRLCETLKPLSFDDLLVLANAASVEFASQVSRGNNVSKEAAQESLLAGVEEDTCKQREAGDMDHGGSCFGLPEKPQRNRELVQQRGKATLVKVVKEDTPNRGPSDGHREEKLFEKKYVRRRNKEQLESTSVEAVAGTSNGVKKLHKHKRARLIYVDDAQREDGLYDSGQTRSVKGQGHCRGTKAQTANKTDIGVENQQITRKSSLIPSILGITNQEIPKRKRSKRKRESGESKRNTSKRREAKEHACDQISSDASDLDTEAKEDDIAEEPQDGTEENTISEGESEENEAETDSDADKPEEDDEENTMRKADSNTEADEDSDTEKPEEDDEEENTISKVALSQAASGSDTVDEAAIVSDSEDPVPLCEVAQTEEKEGSEASSCKWLSFRTRPRSCYGMRNVRWSIKKKTNRMTLHETQSNRKILLLALETITPQFGLLKVSSEVTKKKKKK